MATAVQPDAETRRANPTTRLLAAGLAGAAFLILGVAVAGYAVPALWEQFVAPTLVSTGGFVNVFLRIAIQLATIGGLIYFGSRLGGDNPPRGTRGSIFLWLMVLIAVFFIARAIGLSVGAEAGPIAFAVAFVALLVVAWRLLATKKAVGWMHALEEQGLFHATSYKRSQGQRIRRYTIIGLLLIGLSGVWTMHNQYIFGSGDWKLAMPFTEKPITVLTAIQYSGPVLLAALVLWLSWRAVNMPAFADFLIATEAEMNKVSWSPRKRLVQDTVVVLLTTALLAVFLLFVDLFWGWLLSRPIIGVLPPQQVQRKSDPQGTQTEW